MSLQSEDSFDQPLQEVADEPELIFFQITKKTGQYGEILWVRRNKSSRTVLNVE